VPVVVLCIWSSTSSVSLVHLLRKGANRFEIEQNRDGFFRSRHMCHYDDTIYLTEKKI